MRRFVIELAMVCGIGPGFADATVAQTASDWSEGVLSQAEAVELRLKVVRGTGLSARDVFFCSPGFQAMANGPHVLERITAGNGKVAVKCFDVFEPPLR